MGRAEIRAVPLTRLTPAPWNPRLIRDQRFKTLCQSIQADPDFLWRRPVLAMADGTIYAGNLRFRAAQHLGWTEIPAILDDVPEQLAKERALRDNNQWGEWQEDELGELLYELKMADSDLDLLGFDSGEVARLLTQVGDGGRPDPGPQVESADELREKWQTATGQVWEIKSEKCPGQAHRLMCGDSTNARDVDCLWTINPKAALLVTDPPYNVAIDYGTAVDDAKSATDYETFSKAWMRLWCERSQKQIITPGCNNLSRWLRWFDVYHVAPWIKTNSMTNGKVARWWCWEPMLFLGDEHEWSWEPIVFMNEPWARKRANDVFNYPIGAQPNVADHPCPKPLNLWSDLIGCYTKPGELVADAFCGAGTTIVAAEQLGRIALTMELEPKWVAVALERVAGMGLEPILAVS